MAAVVFDHNELFGLVRPQYEIHLDVVFKVIVQKGYYALRLSFPVYTGLVYHGSVHRHADRITRLGHETPDCDVVKGLAIAVMDFI